MIVQDLDLNYIASSRGWDVAPMWSIARRVDRKGYPDAELLSVYRDYGVIRKSDRDDNHNVESEDLSNYKYVKVGDLVLNKMKTWQGSLGVSAYDGIVSPAYFTCELNSAVYGPYIHYLLRSMPYIAMYGALSKGIRVGQWDLPYEEFRDIPVLLPPLEEQRRIADYLDTATNNIDATRSQILRLVELLDEYFSNQLAAVFASSNRTTTPLRRLVKLVNGGTPDPSEDNWMGKVPWATPVDLGRANGKIISETDRMLTEKGLLTGSRLIPANSLIISTRAPIGYIAINTLPMAFNQGCKGAVINSDVDIYYLQFALLSKVAELQSLGTGSTFMELSNDALKNISVPRRENLLEEKEVTLFISKLQMEVQRRKELLAIEIELLYEYKTSLITAAVTGTFDVTTGRSVA